MSTTDTTVEMTQDAKPSLASRLTKLCMPISPCSSPVSALLSSMAGTSI